MNTGTGSENSGVGAGIDASSDADAHLRQRERQLVAYARLLDSAIRLPGGYRIGLDGLIGLLPGFGDLIGAGLSGYLIYGSAQLGVRRSVILKMIANVAIETSIGVVPVLGDAFDFVFKANERNARLLQAELARREGERTVASARGTSSR